MIRNLLSVIGLFANVAEAARLTSGQNYLSADRVFQARRLLLETPEFANRRDMHAHGDVLLSDIRRAA